MHRPLTQQAATPSNGCHLSLSRVCENNYSGERIFEEMFYEIDGKASFRSQVSASDWRRIARFFGWSTVRSLFQRLMTEGGGVIPCQASDAADDRSLPGEVGHVPSPDSTSDILYLLDFGLLSG